MDHDALRDAVKRGDLAALVGLERAAHARDPDAFELFGARWAMALVPGVEAALTTVATLRERGVLHRPPPHHVPQGYSHLPAGRFVRRGGGAAQHADWAARTYGALLAFTHVGDAPHVLDAMLRRFGDDTAELHDLFGCLLQECVLRGATLERVPAAQRLSHALADAGHPLGTLPIVRLALEAGVEARASTYGVQSSGGWNMTTAPHEASAPSAPLDVRFDDVTSRTDARIAAAFESHCQVSNGKAEARVLCATPAIDPSAEVGLVRALAASPVGLACLEGLEAADESLEVHRFGASDALQALLVFASNGGDYNVDWSGAYGRLAAWRSLAGLVDVPESTSLAQIEARALACRFLHFRASTSWFYQVITNLGLVAIRDQGASVAVLAGTDTD